MRLHRLATLAPRLRALARMSRPLKPRSRYPNVSILPTHRGPLRKLASIFGFYH